MQVILLDVHYVRQRYNVCMEHTFTGIYTIATSSLSGGSISTSLYSNPSFTALVTYTGLSANTPYYVKINDSSSTDATYNVTVNQAGGTSYTSTDVPKVVPDGDTVTGATSTITVSGGPTLITKVVVSLSISLTYDADVDIYLIAPDGTQIELSTDNGSSGDNYTRTVFDDSAATSITSGTAPFTGTYRPEQPLSGLNGKNANGTWTLHLYDDLAIYVPTLTAWSIAIQ